MMSHSRVYAGVLFIAGVVAVAYFLGSAGAQDKEKAPAAGTKWEYRIVAVNKEDEGSKELNKWSEEGFEVAFVTGSRTFQPKPFANGATVEVPVVYFTLKRPRR
ncbi:MAG TPA: hypothetical protein VGE74_02565 [Gemmata sp.]